MEQVPERLAFKNRTNRCDDDEIPRTLSQDKKRPANEDNKSSRKRVKLTSNVETIDISDEEDDVVLLSGTSSRRWSMFAMRNRAMSCAPFGYSRLPQSTAQY